MKTRNRNFPKVGVVNAHCPLPKPWMTGLWRRYLCQNLLGIITNISLTGELFPRPYNYSLSRRSRKISVSKWVIILHLPIYTPWALLCRVLRMKVNQGLTFHPRGISLPKTFEMNNMSSSPMSTAILKSSKRLLPSQSIQDSRACSLAGCHCWQYVDYRFTSR